MKIRQSHKLQSQSLILVNIIDFKMLIVMNYLLMHFFADFCGRCHMQMKLRQRRMLYINADQPAHCKKFNLSEIKYQFISTHNRCSETPIFINHK